ncbi:hypothetical protein Hanom_Chr07g00606341 [Helianthus anomalus]
MVTLCSTFSVLLLLVNVCIFIVNSQLEAIKCLISRALGLHFADFSTFFLNLDAFELRKCKKTCAFRVNSTSIF